MKLTRRTLLKGSAAASGTALAPSITRYHSDCRGGPFVR
jgi:hypothetical protein